MPPRSGARTSRSSSRRRRRCAGETGIRGGYDERVFPLTTGPPDRLAPIMVAGVSLFDNTPLAAAVIIGGTAAVGLGGFLITMKVFPGIRDKKNNELTSFVFGVVSTLYAILLGFVTVVV